jgi:transcriptional regulator with XRE-family HTH domain
MLDTTRPVGELLREWRQRRRLSQLDLALDAEISTRHLSFLETGRSSPSRDMLLRLAEQLDVPLRERNALLVAAGFAPVFSERRLDDPALHPARQAMDLVLAAHDPFPALAVDRHWTMVAANPAVAPLMAGVAPALLNPPVNVMRVALHPDGLAPRTANLWEWRGHLLARLRRQVELSADAKLAELLHELTAYPATPPRRPTRPAEEAIVLPLQLQTEWGLLSLVSTTTVFGTPVDVTVAELALETFFPADAATAAVLRDLADRRQPAEAPRIRSAAQAAP